MKLILQRDNVIRMIQTWGYPFSPGNYQYIDSSKNTIEHYKLVAIRNKKGYYVFNNETKLHLNR